MSSVPPTLDGTKRPRNAFLIYRVEKAKELKDNLDKAERICSQQVSKLLAARWNDETQEVRKHFFDLAEQEKEQHKRLFPDYKYRPRRKRKSEEGAPENEERKRRASVEAGERKAISLPAKKERGNRPLSCSSLPSTSAEMEHTNEFGAFEPPIPIGQALTSEMAVPTTKVKKSVVQAVTKALPPPNRLKMEEALHYYGLQPQFPLSDPELYYAAYPTPTLPSNPADFGLHSPSITLRTTQAPRYQELTDWNITPSSSSSSAPFQTPTEISYFDPQHYYDPYSSALISMSPNSTTAQMHSLDGQLLTETHTSTSSNINDLLRQIFGNNSNITNAQFPTLLSTPNYSRPISQHQQQTESSLADAMSFQQQHQQQKKSSSVPSSIAKIANLFKKGKRATTTTSSSTNEDADWSLIEPESAPEESDRKFRLNGEYTRETLLRMLQEG